VSPFTTILQVQASDADVALNSQIYYSLVEWSLDFMVDPISGAIRNLRPLESGTYELTVLAEDRASRLFRKKAHSDDGNNLFNHNKAKAVLFSLINKFSFTSENSTSTVHIELNIGSPLSIACISST
ncbi:hypothetical protein WUBG_16954, partial [Wuchereria bancrofti]